MTSATPVILFAYNRPHFTRQTLDALSKNHLASETDLFIFADGPKEGSTPSQIALVNEVAELAKNTTGFKSVTVQSSPVNKGLANSVIDGVQQMLDRFEAIIVIEDDVVTSPYFLQFMNDALQYYKNDEKVMSIGSWNYYYKDPLMQSFFTHLPDTIAWATWRRSWQLFERNEKKLYQLLKEQNLLNDFNLQGRFPYETMLQQQIEGKVNSWAIRWTANALLQGKLCLYPNTSLSKHIGFGNDSTHVKSADYNADLQLASTPILVGNIPVVHNPAAVEAFIHFEKKIRPFKTSYKKQWKKQFLTQWELFKKPFKKIFKKQLYGWFGNYKLWKDAEADTSGYDQQSILEKVTTAVLKVKTGAAVYERDSVLFDIKSYSAPLVSTLLYVAAKNNNQISVLDFGGSLGSSYFQHKEMLDKLQNVQWNVVEQLNFVNTGKKLIADEQLQFFETVDEVIEKKGLPDLLMLSCTLPYIEKPYALIEFLVTKKIPYLLIENTPFNFAKGDRLTIQKVNPVIYEASYPCWFLDSSSLVEKLSDKYRVILKEYTGTSIELDHHTVPYQSILFELKS